MRDATTMLHAPASSHAARDARSMALLLCRSQKQAAKQAALAAARESEGTKTTPTKQPKEDKYGTVKRVDARSQRIAERAARGEAAPSLFGSGD